MEDGEMSEHCPGCEGVWIHFSTPATPCPGCGHEAELAAVHNLLAVVHGDGGQHVQGVGIERACKEGENIYHSLRAEVERLKDVNREITNRYRKMAVEWKVVKLALTPTPEIPR
jgi:hypothetical protein